MAPGKHGRDEQMKQAIVFRCLKVMETVIKEVNYHTYRGVSYDMSTSNFLILLSTIMICKLTGTNLLVTSFFKEISLTKCYGRIV